jgi:hypothetical protein
MLVYGLCYGYDKAVLKGRLENYSTEFDYVIRYMNERVVRGADEA